MAAGELQSQGFETVSDLTGRNLIQFFKKRKILQLNLFVCQKHSTAASFFILRLLLSCVSGFKMLSVVDARISHRT